MKFTRVLLVLVAVAFMSSAKVSAETIKHSDTQFYADSVTINLQATISLWYEDYKNKDYKSSLNHAWKILEADPSFTKYKFYKKFEDMYWSLFEDEKTTPEEKEAIKDTMIVLYDTFIERLEDVKDKAYYTVRKAFVLETWHEADPAEVIATYKKAFEMDKDLDDYYYDRLGKFYIAQDNKLDALEIYSFLADRDPDNPLWPQNLTTLADNPEELLDIRKTVWSQDRDNDAKAWAYANQAIRLQKYDVALEPLEHLTTKSADVINYWKELSRAYDKLEMTDKAIDAYKTLIKLQPDGRENYVNLALIYKKKNQLSVSRSFLQKASKVDPQWDYPHYIEAQLYEQAARECMGDKFEFMDKCVYQLAVDTYKKAAALGGSFAGPCKERVVSLKNSVPQKEDYFFRKINSGAVIKVEGKCYGWIGRSITAP